MKFTAKTLANQTNLRAKINLPADASGGARTVTMMFVSQSMFSVFTDALGNKKLHLSYRVGQTEFPIVIGERTASQIILVRIRPATVSAKSKGVKSGEITAKTRFNPLGKIKIRSAAVIFARAKAFRDLEIVSQLRSR